MYIENENTFKSCLQNGVNLFLGAGFSVAARGTFKNESKAMPVGNTLKNELLQEFRRDLKSNFTLAQLCQVIQKTEREALNNFFCKRFTVVDFDPLYKNIERLNIKSIFTTNVDDLIQKILDDSQKYYINDVSLRGSSISGVTAVDYMALHGSVAHIKNNNLDFTPLEISSSFDRDKDKWYSYKIKIQQTPTIYWGYSVADAGVLQVLSNNATSSQENANQWITLTSKDDEAIEYYSSLGFQIIVADTIDLLKYIGQIQTKKTPGAPKKLLFKRFPEYLIPVPNKTPVRTLEDFYLGAEPIWYDINFGMLHKTKHFSLIQNCILGGNHCFIVGAAVTGKTTLLKMLATTILEKQSIFIDNITTEKAKLLKNDIDAEGLMVIVYIDNAADAWEAIRVLIESNNIQIVAAERDYIYDSVAHRFSKNKFTIFGVSGLNRVDIQSIKDKIPANIKKITTSFIQNDSDLSVDFEPTFFEIFDNSISGHSLEERFIDALKNLKIEAPDKHDALLLCCYLYACRVPTSIDVATSFLIRSSNNPEKIYLILEEMHTLLSRYEGSLIESDQAYFVPRSRSVAEAVIKRIEAPDLKRLLLDFHELVSTTKIPRYDIFRRGAYDANLTNKAFLEWQEGLEFYQKFSYRDPSAAFRQQAALYLSRKKQYTLAFKWIDDAMSIAGKFGASIRNTYAVILFNANYESTTAANEMPNSLDESMEILHKCYTDDLRKIYHAKVYADQALKYFDKFPNRLQTKNYLAQSNTWLNAELALRLGDRAISILLKKIKYCHAQ